MPRACRRATSATSQRPSLDTSPRHSLYRAAVTTGRLSQRESVPFTRERSKVRSLQRPPRIPSIPATFLTLLSPHSATQNRTKREDDTSTRGKFVDFVHAAFHVKINPCPLIKTTLMHFATRLGCSSILAWLHALPIWSESLLNYCCLLYTSPSPR